MTLIAAGQNTRNRAMLGLQAMSQEEAEREALYQQMVQAQKAQRAQLAGTGLGIAGSYAANNPDKVAALGSKLFGGGQAAGLNIAAPSAAGLQQSVAGATKLGGEVAAVLKTPVAGSLEAGVTNALGNVGTTGGSSFLSGSGAAGLSATAPAAQAASGAAATAEGLAATQAAVAQATGAATTGTAATGAATGAATAGTGGAAGAAGSLAPLAGIAAPLAIGLGAFFLLNKLFD